MGILERLFCKHEKVYYTKQTRFYHLQGKRVYCRCSKCGKELDSEFVTNDEMYFRFGRIL